MDSNRSTNVFNAARNLNIGAVAIAIVAVAAHMLPIDSASKMQFLPTPPREISLNYTRVSHIHRANKRVRATC